MKKTCIFCVILLFFCFFGKSVQCQEIYKPGARSKAMGGYDITLDDCWSVFANQAGIASAKQITFATSYENKFMIRDWSLRSLVLVIPVRSSVFAVSGYQFGKGVYKQDRFGLIYAKKILPNLQFGVQFTLSGIYFPETNRMERVSGVEMGIIYSPTKDFFLGFHVKNPYRTKIKTYSGQIDFPSQIGVGCHWLLADKVLLGTQVDKKISDAFHFRTGLEYRLLKNLYIRSGVDGSPYRISSGIGFSFRKIIINLAYSYHLNLGDSPSVSLQYNF